MSSNPFDQFDEPSARPSSNAFDQFDSAPDKSGDITALRERFARGDLPFEDWRRLKALETKAGIRKQDGPGVTESFDLIGRHPRAAAAAVPRVLADAAREAPGAVAKGAGDFLNLLRTAPAGIRDTAKRTYAAARKIGANPQLAARIAVSTDAIPRALEAELRGIGSGAGGLGDVVQELGQAAGERLSGAKPSTPRELAERAQYERERAAASNPEAFVGGQLFGGTAAFRKLTPAAEVGKPVANITRGAAAGGAAAGSQASLEGRDVGEALAAGAAGGAVIPAAARGGQFALRPITDRLRSTQAAERTLAYRSGDGFARALKNANGKPLANTARIAGSDSAGGLRNRRLGFEKETARAPNIAEIVSKEAAQEIGETAGRGGARAARVITEAANEAPVSRQGNLRRVIQRGRPEIAEPNLARRQKASMDRFMSARGRDKVIFTRDEAGTLLRDPGIRRIIAGSTPKAFERFANAASKGGETVEISLRDVDNIRRVLNKAANAGGEALRFRDVGDHIRSIATESVPAYDSALGEFAGRARTIEGLPIGSKVSVTPSAEFRQAFANADVRSKAGVRAGARGELLNKADTPQGAARLSRSLAEDERLRANLRAAFGDQEAGRLRAAGAAEHAAGERLATAGIAAQGARRAAENADEIARVIEGVTVLGGRASGGFVAHFATRLVENFRIPPTAAHKLAEMAVDRKNVDRVIERLHAAKVRDEDIANLFQQSAAAAGVATSSAGG